ncbi:hypothetical protein LINPERHAP2_LOCUS2139 [Linum perenne]
MERQPKKKSAAAGEEEDRISELSDEILHSVLIRIPCPLESARTSLLSRRWKYLWRSYPIVECYDAWMGRFQRFSDSTVKRFSLDNLLRMESLKIKFEADEDSCSSCAAEQLLDLASKRKAEHVEVSCYVHLCRLPFKLLSNSSARILRLEAVKLFSEKNGTCRWEADFEMRPFRTWFASFRNFIARFSEFQTINFRCYYCPRSEGFASKMKDLDFATRSLAIQHLRIEPHFSSKDNEEGFDKHHAWQYRLKNVKIVARGVDHVVQKENGLMGVPENVLTWLKTQNEVRFVLTWD